MISIQAGDSHLFQEISAHFLVYYAHSCACLFYYLYQTDNRRLNPVNIVMGGFLISLVIIIIVIGLALYKSRKSNKGIL